VPIDVIVYKELELIGSLGMAAHRFSQMLPMIVQGRLTPARLINREVRLSEVGAIFESMTVSTNSGAFVVTRVPVGASLHIRGCSGNAARPPSEKRPV
jgi:D-arabinose 1-dehydrogenase-like Zn-dependent alcohol dehydrogenase